MTSGLDRCAACHLKYQKVAIVHALGYEFISITTFSVCSKVV